MLSDPARRGFAEVIDDTRKRRHLSIRDVARIAGVPAATAQGWLNGKHFPVPALRPNYLRIVEALELSDCVPAGLWGESWTILQPRLRTDHPPYLGLRPFASADHALYFGRDQESSRLTEAVLAQRRVSGHGMIAVVGVSGSGKSSLIAAGLLGRQTTDGLLADWSIARLTVESLVQSPEVAGDLVVIDQFEEVFALDDVARESALTHLAAMVDRSVVLIALRADAFAVATQEPLLADALAHPFLVTPLTRDEAREVITAPAEAAGVRVDDELVSVVLDDLTPGPHAGTVAVDVLPLLSNALLVTWATGAGDRMTVADYARAGGIASAVQGLAEDVYQSLDVTQQHAAQRLLLRLVRLSGDMLVRDSLPLDDIDVAGQQALDAFIAARMLTVSDTAARIGHDALLTHWSRLYGWIVDSRADLAVTEQFRRACQVWHDSGRSPDALIPVERLEVFTEWLAGPQRDRLLSPRERDFIAASRQHFASELAREQELNTKLRRGRNLALAMSTLVLVLALVTGLFYWQGRGLQAAADTARLDSQSRQVALEARSIRSNDGNLMSQMALVADSLADTRQGESILIDATAVNAPTRWLGAPGAVIATSPDERLVARANSAGEVTLWRADQLDNSPGMTFRADPSGGPLYGLALATIGDRRLLAVGGQRLTGLWDVTADPVRLAELPVGEATTYGLAFDPVRPRLAAATSSGDVVLWSLRHPARPAREATLGLDSDKPARAVAFSPTNGQLFVAGPTNAVARWSLANDPRRLPDLTFDYADTGGAAKTLRVDSQTVAVSPDGRQVVVGIQGRIVPRWRLDGDRATTQAPLTGFASWTNDLSYSRDGRSLLVANSDQQVYVFEAASGQLRRQLGDSAVVTGVEMVANRPVSAGGDGALRVWDAREPTLRIGGTVFGLSSDAADEILAATTLDDGIELWDLTGDLPQRLPDPDPGRGRTLSSALAVAPNGRFMVGGTTKPQGELLSWPLSASGPGRPEIVPAFPSWYVGAVAISADSSVVAALQYTGTKVALYRADPTGHLTAAATLTTLNPQSLSFSPDGKLLAIPIDGNVQLWDVSNPAAPELAGTIDDLESSPTVAVFGHAARTLAIGSASGYVTVWDADNPASPVRTHGLGDPQASINSLAFSPDDRTLVAGGGDNLVWGWHLDSNETEAYLALDGEVGRTNDVRFLDGGRTLVAGGSDGPIRTWLFPPEEARTLLCGRRGTHLTPDEWRRYLPGVDVFDPC